MARRSYDKMYDEKKEVKEVKEAAPAEEPIIESAEAEPEVEAAKEPEVAKEIPATKPFMGVVTGGFSLNVRKAPNGDIITTISEGAQVRVLEEVDNGWYRIESPKGFVMKKFIKKGK